jgi:tetratricopeptide (TPR) repeat protein/transcriptional regulator with XRE-family HTH domain
MTTTTAGAAAAEAATLAERLRLLRTRALLTQEQLAERARVSVRTVRNLEAGRIRRPRAGSLRLLADALGLTEAERALLAELTARDPDPDPETVTVPAASRPRPVRLPQPPRLLPPVVADFTGRHRQLTTILGLLDQDGGPHPVVVSGSAGVGKTALAVHAAHTVADRFTDGQLFVNLRGHDPAGPLEPAQALAALLYGLGVAPEEVPAEAEAAVGLYRSLLADRRVLVVLDNAHSAAQVRPLLPASTGSRVLVTSRDRLTGLLARDGAHRLSLGVLDPEEAAELLARLLGPDRTQAEPEAAAELASACALLPLALRVAAATLADQPDCRLADYVGELRTGGRLVQLAIDGDPHSAIKAAFDLSYQSLASEARRLFRLLGLLPGQDVSTEAAAALAGRSPGQARRLLGLLAAANLVEEQVPGRFGFHDLLREYATERAHQAESEADRVVAVGRLLDWYLATAAAAARLLYPGKVRLGTAACDRLPSRDATFSDATFSDEAKALAWLDDERPNLLAAIQHAAAHGPPAVAWLLADALRGYFLLRRRNLDWLAAAQTGLGAASEAEPAAQAAMRLSLGDRHWFMGQSAQAVEQYTGALDLAVRAGWLDGQAVILNNLGSVLSQLGRLKEVVQHYMAALALNRQTGRRGLQVSNLGNLGIVSAELGRLAEAVDFHTQALAICQEIGSRDLEAAARWSFGTTLRELGRLDEAQDQLGRALVLTRILGDRYGEAVSLNGLAAVHGEAGRHGEALDLATPALKLARDIEDREVEAVVSNTLAAVSVRLGDARAALDHGRHALRLARETGSRNPEVVALIGLAAAHRHLGQLQPARTAAEQALLQARQTGYRILEGAALTTLAQVALATGDGPQAATRALQAIDIQRATGHRLGQARALLALGHALHHTGDPAAAAASWQEALALFVSVGSPEADEARACLSPSTGSEGA